MPELPEVETIARGLNSRVAGDVIESVWLGSKPEPLKSPAREIVAALESKHIAGVRRVGKHIVFDLENGGRAGTAKKTKVRTPAPTSSTAQWIVHLGMTGRMLVCPPEEEIAKHTHAIARLASGRELRFVDPRRFGRLSVSNGFAAPGSEPLDVELARFVKLFHGRKTPIKSALLNQNLLSGVGNIYADESLFRAHVRPRRRATSLTQDDLGRLYQAVQEVLKEAIALGGSSISDYVDSDGEEGFFQLQHRVYGREGEPCLVCKTSVKRVVIAGRSAHYCPKCQK
ncbi:MAG TPA: bifunctional DNA-formamidopyrimidine glycosylase/DNA-(apurinic or apyrimidinic site) lyase [Terriglobales bacterium]|jgi:formamidopyrimidine-DNA glycosylase|nr:bifunctional DNA-formamidopyrimidine glycosylase/DNA-(apurinic or apyrimidinic site) lyase [Terriglobales bacterium]